MARSQVDEIIATVQNMTPIDVEFNHYFSPGIFAREMIVPSGVCVGGAEHRIDNIAILSSGTLRILRQGENEGYDDLHAPALIQVRSGNRNAAICISNEPAIWTNFYPNPDDERDVDTLMERYYHCRASDLIGGKTNVQMLRNSYFATIAKYGFTHERVLELVHRQFDETDPGLLTLGDSPIDGHGLFLHEDCPPGVILAPMILNGRRQIAGRFCNHSPYPNAEAKWDDNGNMILVSITQIKAGDEVVTDYGHTLSIQNYEEVLCQVA